MSQLYDYLLTLEAAPEDDRTGSALCALYLGVAATGTCGVTTQGTVPCDGVVPGREDQDGYDPAEGGCTGIVLPGLVASGAAACAPGAEVVLPVPECRALGPEWFPAVGDAVLPAPEVSGTARTLVVSVSALPPLFALALAGAAAGAELPRPEAAGATGAVAEVLLPGVWTLLSASGLDRRADGQARVPVPEVEAYACALANPVVRRTPSSTVVRLLNRDSAVLSLLARTLAGELEDMDEKAAALLYAVSNLLTYVSDPESLDYGDQWTCAVATWFRGYGDCEDGAVLLHGLLLALGADANRVVTIFGRVGSDNLGHAWTCYKRQADEAWTILDWTTGARSPLAGPDDLPRVDQSPDYHGVEYALTGERFTQARMSVAEFFPSVRADELLLPLPECAGETNLSGRGAVSLVPVSGLFGTLACRGDAGGMAGMEIPGLDVSGAAGWRSGRVEMPGPDCAAASGATGGAVLPVPGAAATAGARAAGTMRISPLRASGVGCCAAVCAAGCRLPRTRLRGVALAGVRAAGVAGLPGPAVVLAGYAGGVAWARMAVPELGVVAGGFFDVSGGGVALCGPPAAFGSGVADAGAFAGVRLGYRDGEVW
ncbi:transglutaminase domain-containing protein [Desulfolutivibrio sulfoxidireducens]|uniref:transglutaminase domain-containing protein n=1 Tax=Desulfolutivibrio sulfoxidireducens TaxID=2773299 RepID=UPI00159DBB97|nr:transglutaminase domain-containing protein [Desulfolutivibrio sulfoxidireducens]QLA17698.1 hypothetical protein GD605_17245 [Desulfolutivibrio sulfoxidireducens]